MPTVRLAGVRTRGLWPFANREPDAHPRYGAWLTPPDAERTLRAMDGANRKPAAAAGLEDVSRRLKTFLAGKGVLKAIVFGSWARGTNTRPNGLPDLTPDQVFTETMAARAAVLATTIIDRIAPLVG